MINSYVHSVSYIPPLHGLIRAWPEVKTVLLASHIGGPAKVHLRQIFVVRRLLDKLVDL